MICKLIFDILDYSIAIDGIYYAPVFMMVEDLIPIMIPIGLLFGFGWKVVCLAFDGFIKLIKWLISRWRIRKCS